MTSRTRLLVILVSTPVIVFAVLGGVLGKTIPRDDTYRRLRIFEDVISLVVNNYVEEVNVDKVMGGAMNGLADALDADSAYLTPSEVKQFEAGDKLGEGQTGLELTRQYYLRVIAARDQSPAAKAGLRLGDYVRAIDGKPTRDMSVFQGMRLLRGAVGSTVKLTVIRGNAAEPLQIDIVRAKLTAPDITSRTAGPGVGYVRVAAFDAGAAGRINAEVQKLTQSGASSVVIDVRGAAFGSVDEGIAAARLFVGGAAPLAWVETRDGKKDVITGKANDGAITIPAAILIDAGATGPAEVFSAALVNAKRADLIGERTLGRAARQKLVRLPDGSGLWLTYARFVTADGTSIHERGLTPSVEVESPDVELGAPAPTTDPVLDKAVERLSAKKAA